MYVTDLCVVNKLRYRALIKKYPVSCFKKLYIKISAIHLYFSKTVIRTRKIIYALKNYIIKKVGKIKNKFYF